MAKVRTDDPRLQALRLGEQATAGQFIPRPDRRAAVARTLRRPQFWFGVTVLIPTLIWYWIFSFQPIFSAFWIAVHKYQVLAPSTSPFIGFDNFRYLWANPLFLVAVRNTLLWGVLAFTLTLPLALLLSVCLANVARGRNLYQFFIFLPVVVSLVAITLLFRMLMDPDIGQFNTILNALGLHSWTWLSDSSSALPTAVGIGVWKGIGGTVVLLTAGMLNIPAELQDAALVDGANEWQRFWKITLPLLSHTLVLVMVLLAIGSLQEFTLPQLLSTSGAGNSLYVLNILIYNEAFQNLRFGTATAAALLQFAFILVISMVQLKLIRPKWSY
ncbi:MAG: sugar ABC transporter permease [Herpetosiphonaceae bacterium]|nr:sugar ABC transporter permease [Herpetosiphonaceae bacterium]